MLKHGIRALLVLGLSYPGLLSGQEPGQAVPLYDDLGDHAYEITTTDPAAQAYFDQGLRLYYAFNHAEAIKSFRQAQAIDQSCAMCAWGEALAFGPNINLPMDAPSGIAAFEALQRAIGNRAHASEKERGLIDALAQRYVPAPLDERSELDEAYAAAMAGLHEAYPEDTEIAVLYAESLMDLRPWDYWTEDGEPASGISAALSSLTSVLAANENHPGACHFYIHAVEKAYPELAVPCAERLAALMPGAGHLVHMPGHIYIRVGRYQDAIDANRHAVHADETYIQDQRPGMTVYTAGYYPHNYDFLAFAAMMAGDEGQAMTAARQVEALIPQEMVGEAGMDFLQHWSIRPLLVGTRFGRWNEIMATPEPPKGRSHSIGIWHYAQGRARAATGDLDTAREHLAVLRGIAAGTEHGALRMEFNQSADLLAIAEAVLAGWIDAEAGDFAAAVSHMEAAVALEDGLLYGEPPEWTVPVRQELGAVLLRAGDPAAAAVAFREDLARFPANHWSVEGLARAEG